MQSKMGENLTLLFSIVSGGWEDRREDLTIHVGGLHVDAQEFFFILIRALSAGLEI